MPMVSLREVAERAGVSPGTVSNYFHHPEKVSAATRERVARAVEALGFRPNAAAQALRRGESRLIAYLALEIANQFSAELMEGADAAAHVHGYDLLAASSGGETQRQQRYLELFERQRVAGVVITPVGEPAVPFKEMIRRGIAVVSTDPIRGLDEISTVSVDDYAGGRLAGRHLIETGHRRFAFVGVAPGIDTIDNRVAGLRDAISAAGPLRELSVDSRSIGDGVAAGRMLFAEDRSDIPTGIVAVNDLVAIGVLHALLAASGGSMPPDVGIVGFDDIEFARNAIVPLTSVRRPAADFGTRAVEILLSGIGGGIDQPPVHEVFTPTLVARASTVR